MDDIFRFLKGFAMGAANVAASATSRLLSGKGRLLSGKGLETSYSLEELLKDLPWIPCYDKRDVLVIRELMGSSRGDAAPSADATEQKAVTQPATSSGTRYCGHSAPGGGPCETSSSISGMHPLLWMYFGNAVSLSTPIESCPFSRIAASARAFCDVAS